MYNSPGDLVNNVEQEPTKPYVVVSLGTGMAPEVAVKDYDVSTVSGPLGAGRFLLGVKEFAETLIEQVWSNGFILNLLHKTITVQLKLL